MPNAATARQPGTAVSGPTYERRAVERTTLYQLVRDHLESFYQAVEEGFASAPLPKFVKQEFERYLACGVLCRGAALLVCDACEKTNVIALSCKGRGFCPSCLGRRMEQTAANLEEHVLPQDVPLRQWVLTFPFELRARLGFDGKLLSELCGLVNRVLLDFYERTVRTDAFACAASDRPEQHPKLQGGSVTVVQRTSSDLRLNPHLHIVALDGIFAPQQDGPPRFTPLPRLSSLDVAEVLATVRARVLRRLQATGVLDLSQDFALSSSEAAEREPALCGLAAAAATGKLPAGPERRQRVPLRLAAGPAQITGPLCATDSGFSLHAATVVAADNLRGKHALLRYVLRPPLGQQRLQLLQDGLCRITLKRPFSDGTFAIDLDPLSLLCRLAAAVPAPGFNTVRYAGVLASASRLRPALIPKLSTSTQPSELGGAESGQPQRGAHRRSGWRPWSELLKRSFDVELRCPDCGATMKLKSWLVGSSASLRRLLSHLGEPTEVKGKAPSRGPPYFASKVVRRQLGQPSFEQDLFD